jgi:hypothetical protein
MLKDKTVKSFQDTDDWFVRSQSQFAACHSHRLVTCRVDSKAGANQNHMSFIIANWLRTTMSVIAGFITMQYLANRIQKWYIHEAPSMQRDQIRISSDNYAERPNLNLKHAMLRMSLNLRIRTI